MRTLLYILVLLSFTYCTKEKMIEPSKAPLKTTSVVNVQIKVTTSYPYDTVKFSWKDIYNTKHTHYIKRCMVINTRFNCGQNLWMLVENGNAQTRLYVVSKDTLYYNRHKEMIKATVNVKVK